MSSIDQTITVRSSAELSQAFSALSASGGGVILVENAGEEYSLQRYKAGSDTGTIRIAAADPEDPPVFTTVSLNQVRNVSFEGLSFDSSDSNTAFVKDIVLRSSTNISFLNNDFRSNATEYYTGENAAGHSLATISYSSDITFSGNTAAGYFNGLKLRDTTNVVISDNEFDNFVADGIQMSGVQDVLIEGNSFEDFYGSASATNHDDFIQVWSASYNTLNTENLTIRDNVFNTAGNEARQTIFIRNETFPSTGAAYKNITIEGNTIHNGHRNGVVIYDTEGVTVEDNTLLWDREAGTLTTADSNPYSQPPAIFLYGVTDATVIGNIAARYYGSGLDYSNNATLQYTDPSSPDFVDTHFVNAVGGQLDLRDLSLREDSPWAGNFGSDATQPQTSGPVTQADSPVTIPTQPLLKIDFDGGVAATGTCDAKLSVLADNTEALAEQDAFLLTGYSKVIVDDDSFDFRGMESFDLSFDLKRDMDVRSHGTFMEVHRSMEAKILDNGSVHFAMQTEDGEWHGVRSDARLVSDEDWHTIKIGYDSDGSGLMLAVDGQLVGHNDDATGSALGATQSDLVIGSTYSSSFIGAVDNVQITDGQQDDWEMLFQQPSPDLAAELQV